MKAIKAMTVPMVLLLAITIPSHHTQAAEFFSIIMTNGMAAPDGNGAFAPLLHPAVLNDAGQVVFEAQLDGALGGTNNTAIYRGDGNPANLVKIARQGDTVPEGNGRFDYLLGGIAGNYAPSINSTGQVLFTAKLTNTVGGSNASGIYLGNGAAGGLFNIAHPGQSAPDGNGNYHDFGSFLPALNDSGQVAFYANLTGTTIDAQSEGIFRGNGVSITQIGRSYELTAFGRLGLPGSPAINSAGQVAFLTTPGSSYGFTATFRGDGPTLTEIAYNGMPLPNSNQIVSAGAYWGVPLVNDVGEVAFFASIYSSGYYPAIFRGDGSNFTVVAVQGQSVGAALTFSTLEGTFSLNRLGQALFAVHLAGPGVGSTNTGALYRGDGTTANLKLIARQGQAAPGGNGIFNQSDFLGHGQTSQPYAPAMNDCGQVAFQSTSTTDSQGIYFFDDRLGLLKVLGEGDPLLGSTVTYLSLYNVPSLGRQSSPLNNRGQIAFTFKLADGTTGLAVWNGPQLQITDIKVMTDNVRITWNTFGGWTNVVQASSSPSSGFSDISGNIIAPGSGQVSLNFTEVGGATGHPARYYRIRLAR